VAASPTYAGDIGRKEGFLRWRHKKRTKGHVKSKRKKSLFLGEDVTARKKNPNKVKEKERGNSTRVEFWQKRERGCMPRNARSMIKRGKRDTKKLSSLARSLARKEELYGVLVKVGTARTTQNQTQNLQ